jgi:hypothetical protein
MALVSPMTRQVYSIAVLWYFDTQTHFCYENVGKFNRQTDVAFVALRRYQHRCQSWTLDVPLASVDEENFAVV